jgi:hypothetical protein
MQELFAFTNLLIILPINAWYIVAVKQTGKITGIYFGLNQQQVSNLNWDNALKEVQGRFLQLAKALPLDNQ